eukprot:CCRYP_006516-RA/>CCRYP_006516-RA protein AED:0.09 eAED:0.09 QI:225/1/1/1/0.5/0.33/3/96/542
MSSTNTSQTGSGSTDRDGTGEGASRTDQDVDMQLDQSDPDFEITGDVEGRKSSDDSGEDSNCSSTLPPHPRNFGVRGNSESFSVSEEDYRGDNADTMNHKMDVDSYTRSASGIPNNFPVTETIATSPAFHHASLSSPTYRETSNFGLLEGCGRWLMSIPRDDVVALQNTLEYTEFLNAFDRLGEAHRRTVMLERRHLLETEDALASCGTIAGDLTEAEPSDISCRNTLTAHPFKRYHSYPLPIAECTRRRHFSFLQHLAVDDVLLRIFEFIDCSSLVRTGTTCHRFHELTNRSADQRVVSLTDGRLLRSAMKMLRAQEQIEGVNVFENSGHYVPIPMLGLRRRIKVSGAGDAEFNGIYFCTGSNGNGFLFTKPRVPERRVKGDNRSFGQTVVGQAPLARAQLQHPIHLEGVEIPVRERVLFANAVVMEEVDENEDESDQRDGGVDVLFGDEPNRSRLLRCVISKRFSNETILWYMSKEVEDEATHEISQMFSFWAKLMVTGDASPDVCRYPSQTSILSRDGEPAWHSLTDHIAPPIVELLDD